MRLPANGKNGCRYSSRRSSNAPTVCDDYWPMLCPYLPPLINRKTSRSCSDKPRRTGIFCGYKLFTTADLDHFLYLSVIRPLDDDDDDVFES